MLCVLQCILYLQWMKSGTGLWTLNDAASRSRQISTLSPAIRRTAALFSSSNTCLCSDAHSSSMKSSTSERQRREKTTLRVEMEDNEADGIFACLLTADTLFNPFFFFWHLFLCFFLSETANTVICCGLLLRYYRNRNVGQNNLDQNGP